MPELSGPSKHLIQQLSLSGIKAPFPLSSFVLLRAGSRLKGELLQASCPSFCLNLREQRDLQGKDPMYKVLMIGITHIWGLDHCSKAAGFKEREERQRPERQQGTKIGQLWPSNPAPCGAKEQNRVPGALRIHLMEHKTPRKSALHPGRRFSFHQHSGALRSSDMRDAPPRPPLSV